MEGCLLAKSGEKEAREGGGAYRTYLEGWDLPVLKFSWQGESGAWRGDGGSPWKKMQFAGSKRMVLVYNDRPGESEMEIPDNRPVPAWISSTGLVCAGRPGSYSSDQHE